MTLAPLPTWTTTKPSSTLPTWRNSSVGHADKDDLVDVGLGLRFRSPVFGPEQEIIDEILNVFRANIGRSRRLTVFCEPALDTGFPDIVAVVWRDSTARKWGDERSLLKNNHLRLLHALANKGWTDIKLLESVFGCSLTIQLDLLKDLDLIVRTKNQCRARSLNAIFAVDKIIAIEAKMSWWQKAMMQASANVWFSSESHVLMPSISSPEALLETARRFNVGVLAFSSSKLTSYCEAPQREVPLSYGSWLFNEWVWRIARKRKQI